MWYLTSDPSKHSVRRLLSHVDHQVATVWRRDSFYRCAVTASAPVPEGAYNRQNMPRTWVSGYTFWDLTSDSSRHVTRRLPSHLEHQKTTVSRRDSFYRCAVTASAPMPEGACNRQNKPRIWVSGYTFWDLTSYPSGHVTRRLLVHLDDQETTVSRRGFIPTGAHTSSLRGV